MNKIFDNSIMIKILSVVVATIIWAFIMGYQDPADTRWFYNVDVELDAENSLPVKLGYSIIQGSDSTVNIKVEGKRSDLARLDKSDVKVTADINSLTRAGTFSSIPVAVQVANNKVTASVEPRTISIRLDTLTSARIPVKASVSGTVADGYMFGTITAEPTVMSVSGPNTDITFINHALADVKVEGATKSFTMETPISLIDKNGDQAIEDYITKEKDMAIVTVQVLKKKTIPVKVNIINDLNLDLSDMKLEYSTTSLTIASEDASIDSISELVLGEVSASELISGVNREFDVMLPSTVKNVDNVKKVRVKASANMDNQRVFEVANFEVINMPEGYSYKIVTESMQITAKGTKSVLDSLSPTNIKLVADMTDKIILSGENEVEASVVFPDENISALGSYRIKMNILAPGGE